jgi:hypothetical protein
MAINAVVDRADALEIMPTRFAGNIRSAPIALRSWIGFHQLLRSERPEQLPQFG